MEKNFIVSKLNKALPGSVLEVRRFGQSDAVSIWIEAQNIQKIALFLKSETELKMDWLENFSVVEFENVFVATYFVRSFSNEHQLIIRISVVPDKHSEDAHLPSVKLIWPMIEPMEHEAEELFGIYFRVDPDKKEHARSRILPHPWRGYPLRKNYQFPEEIFGIQHLESKALPDEEENL